VLEFLSSEHKPTTQERSPFAVLGDDVVIWDDNLAVAYKAFLSAWDIPFSPDKTLTSPRLFEFAKRLFYSGNEISPFPLGALGEEHKEPSSLYELKENAESKGW